MLWQIYAISALFAVLYNRRPPNIRHKLAPTRLAAARPERARWGLGHARVFVPYNLTEALGKRPAFADIMAAATLRGST